VNPIGETRQLTTNSIFLLIAVGPVGTVEN